MSILYDSEMEIKNIFRILRVLFRDATSFILVLLIIIACGYAVSAYFLMDQLSHQQFDAEHFSNLLDGFRSGSRALLWVIIIVSLFKISQLWKLLSSNLGHTATMTPSSAVWCLFIPIFNYFWTFWVYIGMSRDANKILKPTFKVPYWPFVIFCCVDLLVFFLSSVASHQYRVLGDIKSEDVFLATIQRGVILEALCTFVLLGCYLLVLYHMNKIVILINYCTKNDDLNDCQYFEEYVNVRVVVEMKDCGD